MARRALQIVNLLLALLTAIVAAGSLAFGVNSPVYDPGSVPAIPALDSNLRFLGGIGVGLGVTLIWLTPRIERHTALFRAVWLSAMLGGVGRLISVSGAGMPPASMLVFALIEVLGVPMLLVWQSRVAASYSE